VEGRFWRGLGVVADVNGHHTANMHVSRVGLDLVTATFGPRYTLPIGELWPGLGGTFDKQQRISL